MSTYQCPSCQRTFEEPGYCPFDRTQLHDPRAALAGTVVPLMPADKQTIVSAAISAQPEPEGPRTAEVRRETFPMSPTGSKLNQPSQELTASRPRLQTPSEQPKFRAVSATDSEQDAIEAMRAQRGESEYDKLVGQTLDGRYYVEKKIGEGGMGVVFSARHAVIERPLAIKVLKREVMRDTATIQRFVREAKAASRIGHPNIVDVTDFGTTPDGMTYSVMEYVHGDTLGTALRAASPFSAHRAVKIAAQIARALGAAHDKGIIHRDLKPENVFLLNRDGRTDFVKIVDFGIAKVAPPQGGVAEPRLTRAGSVFGTPEYMAPEQAAGRGDTDGRVDIYALGIILYEMVTGRVPHRGDSMVRTLAMQMLDPVEPPSKLRPDLPIPPELEQVILTALAKKREVRYQTMGELLAALEKVLTLVGQSVTGSPIYALQPLPPGADENTVQTPLGRSAAKAGAHSIPTSRPAGPTSDGGTTRRPKSRTTPHEPQFTAGDKPSTFEHVWTQGDLPQQRSRWPLIVLLLLILGGGITAFALLYVKRNTSDPPPTSRDAGIALVMPDAEVVIPMALDAAEVIADAGLEDAQIAIPSDAKDDIVVVAQDAGIRRNKDAGVGVAMIPDTPNQRGTIMVQVLTKPEGATLYVGTSYRGPGGATLEEALGTRLDVRCTQKGYREGKVTVTFDGKTEVALCVLTRIKLCIDNVKNPFDDCEPRTP
ncbi:MAG: protein kinase domain-containing protein [Kofleriaceae bacterium]